ncbi:hypothetical protein FRB98_000744 [Tulasnella sp. 332]|nr:hypothetical protein FRB98_000744 [Tulasnella sp. 332]
MKVSALAVVGIAALAASALPLRIIVITSNITTPSRSGLPHHEHDITSNGGGPMMGHIASSASSPFVNGATPISTSSHNMGCGRHVQSQFLQMSNRLRAALGMPPIITTMEHVHPSSPPRAPHPGEFHVLPFVPGQRMPIPFVGEDGYKMETDPTRASDGSPMPIRIHTMTMPMPHQGHYFNDGAPFVHRLHHAVNHLGPWEGRAVAFVLGCGMGVLIRMLFVFIVLLVRAYRRSASAEDREEATEQTPPRVYRRSPGRV